MNILITFFLFFAFIAYFLLSIVLFYRSKNHVGNTELGLISFFSAIWTAAILCFLSIPNLSVSNLLLLNQTFIMASGLIAASFLQFSFKITSRKKPKKKLLFFVYLPCLMTLFAVLIPGILIENITIQPWGRESILGWGYPYFGIFIVSYFLGGIIQLFLSALSTENLEQRNKFILIIIATSITGLIDIYFNLFLILAGNYHYIWVGPFSSFTWVIVLGLIITKYRILGLKIIISKTLASLFLIVFQILSVLFVLSYLQGTSQKISIIGLLVLWSLSWQPLKNWLITEAKHLFVKGYYDPDQLFNHLSKKIAKEQNRKNLFLTVETTLDDHINFEYLALLIANRDSEGLLIDYQLTLKFPDGTSQTSALKVTNPLIHHFLQHPDLQFLNTLPDTVKNEFLPFKFSKQALFIPFKSPEYLEAILILGERSSGSKLTQTDLDFFETVVNLVSAMLFKLTPYEKLQELYNERERQIARSEKITSLSRVIQDYSHEIRTPLSIIKNRIHRFNDAMSLSDLKTVILEEVDRALDIVTTVLSLSNSKEPRPLEKFDLNEVIQKAIALMHSEVVSVETHLKPLAPINGIAEEMLMVMTNLIQNAFEAMPQGGSLWIRSEQKGSKLIVSVKDTGIGIAEDRLERIWEPFETGHATKGRGLGLSVVHRIVREHLGAIHVKSTVGVGSEFLMVFPVK